MWITLAIALAFHSALISLQANHRLDAAVVRAWLIDIQATPEKAFDRVIQGVQGIWRGYFALVGLHNENQRLQAEIDRLRMELAHREEDAAEAKRLRELMGLQDFGFGKTVVARVIGRDPTQQRVTMTIDKGLAAGVKPDSAVMTPGGVVGRVLYAANFNAVVQLILDAQSSVGVVVQSSRRQAILNGNGGRELDLDYIDDDSDLKAGDKFVTSGQDRIYPRGLPVGTVASIGPRRGMFKTVRVRPSADFDRIEEVICLIERPPGGDQLSVEGLPLQP